MNDATRLGHLETVKCLYQQGVVPDRITLYYAINSGNARLVRFLVSVVELAGHRFPLEVAATTNLETVVAVAEQGVSVRRMDLVAAVEHGDIDIIDYLAELVLHGRCEDDLTTESLMNFASPHSPLPVREVLRHVRNLGRTSRSSNCSSCS